MRIALVDRVRKRSASQARDCLALSRPRSDSKALQMVSSEGGFSEISSRETGNKSRCRQRSNPFGYAVMTDSLLDLADNRHFFVATPGVSRGCS